MHTHGDGTTHEHENAAYQPTADQLLAAASEDVANAHIQIVQLKATLEMQNLIIESLKRQLSGD